MPHTLILTDDRLGPAMAGPAIRAFELARAIARHGDVTLASTQPLGELEATPFPVLSVPPEGLVAIAREHDVIVTGGLLLAQVPALAGLGKYLVLDLYAPLLLEDLEHLRGQGGIGRYLYAEHHRQVGWMMRQADFFLCASDRQRDYYLGRLCALGRLAPGAPPVDRLIGIVPFGLQATPPVPGAPQLRGVLPGIGEEDVVFLWGGGLWEWLDPLTPIRAAAALGAELPELKLVFLAGRSPNPTTPAMPMADQARALAAELGLLGSRVAFAEAWIPYEARGSLLLEADAGITAHQDTLETRFAYRTRVLDYLWAELPVIASRGDVLGDRVERDGLGLACDVGDVEGWAAALRRMGAGAGFREACRSRIRGVKPRYTWEEAVAPLVRYLEAPAHAARPEGPPEWALSGPFSAAAKAFLSLNEEGVSGFSARVKRKLQARRSRPDA